MQLHRVNCVFFSHPTNIELPQDNQFKRMFEGMTSFILKRCNKINLGQNQIIHFRFIDSSAQNNRLNEKSSSVEQFFIPGDEILKNGIVNIKYVYNSFVNLEQKDQRLYLLKIFQKTIHRIAAMVKGSKYDRDNFDDMCDFYRENDCTITTKIKWNKYHDSQYYFGLERNFCLPIICTLYVKRKGDKSFKKFLVDEINHPSQPVSFFPEIEWLNKTEVFLLYYQHTVWINIETNERLYGEHLFHPTENFIFW